MAEFRILKPPAFVSRPDDAGKHISALDIAAAWLAEQSDGGWEPMAVSARGLDARVLLTGDGPESLVVFRREQSKGKR